MNLSANFTLEEFEFSETATANNINNKAPEDVIKNLKELCDNVLEPLRAKLSKPITILSGYRCEELNRAVGGVGNSKHLTGCAADITTQGLNHLDLYNFIKKYFKFDQLILEYVKEENLYSGWVHVSWVGNGNRNQTLKIG